MAAKREGLRAAWLLGALAALGAAELCSLVLMNEERVFVPQDNQWRILGQAFSPDNVDLSSFVDPACSCLSNTTLVLEVAISNAAYFLTQFEYTFENNARGFVLTLPAAPQVTGVGGFVTLAVPVTGFNRPQDTPWSLMNRIELYRSGNATLPDPSHSTFVIRLRRIELRKELPSCAGVPPPPVPPEIPECPAGAFLSLFWANADFGGWPDFARCDARPLKLDVVASRVSTRIPPTFMSAHFSGRFEFAAGRYEFALFVDDVGQLFVDGVLVVNATAFSQVFLGRCLVEFGGVAREPRGPGEGAEGARELGPEGERRCRVCSHA
jgi:hypothetical protein